MTIANKMRAMLIALLIGPASWAADPATVLYLHNDQIGTPRLAVDQGSQVVWVWDGDAFGSAPPNGLPTGQMPVNMNLRFSGQYSDREHALHQNIFREYDPSSGRFIQSDPIGLKGGLNTYAYVDSNPVSRIDPNGLQAVLPTPVGPVIVPAISASGPRIDYRPPDLDPWKDTKTEARVPTFLPPKSPKNNGTPSCRTMYENCMKGAKACAPGMVSMTMQGMCLAAYLTCAANNGGQGGGDMSGAAN